MHCTQLLYKWWVDFITNATWNCKHGKTFQYSLINRSSWTILTQLHNIFEDYITIILKYKLDNKAIVYKGIHMCNIWWTNFTNGAMGIQLHFIQFHFENSIMTSSYDSQCTIIIMNLLQTHLQPKWRCGHYIVGKWPNQTFVEFKCTLLYQSNWSSTVNILVMLNIEQNYM